MATAVVTVRLDAEDKAAMERACKEMGLSMNAAFTIFAKKVRGSSGFPSSWRLIASTRAQISLTLTAVSRSWRPGGVWSEG